ncbi:hypothetical protein ACFWU5_16805 [Nocardia sp. NPDC058640]|uniref:hypothetical protein n=1 Tax=Nocardia sp. NPDC058640 TaxID=3346571 RepID=UPI0036623446
MTTPIVFLDTETDGLHPGRKVWEVAMIRRDDAGERAIQFFVDIDLDTADPFGLKVGRFYDRHPVGQWLSRPGDLSPYTLDRPLPGDDGLNMVLPYLAAELVARWTHGAHIVGAVPNFDTEVLGNLLRENGLTPNWHYHLIDVENLAVGYLAGLRASGRLDTPDGEESLEDKALRLDRLAAIAPPWKSDNLSRLLDVEPPSEAERHTAMGDACWAMRLYDKITGYVEPALEAAA